MTTRTGVKRQKGRDELRKFFGVGQKPTADNFSDLIDSMVNIVDDQIDARLKLTSMPESDATIEFRQRAIDSNPIWKIAINKDDCLSISNGLDDSAAVILHPNNKIEIGCGNDVVIHGRLHAADIVGNAPGTADYEADREWHEIVRGTNGAKAYEVSAVCKVENRLGLFMARAIASQNNNKPIRVIVTNLGRKSLFGSIIRFKWFKTADGCVLKMRSRRNFGKFTKIRVTVKELC